MRKPIESLAFKKDDTELPVEASLSAGLAGKETIYCAIIRNIIERNQAEKTLQKQTHDLGERVKELNCLYGNLLERVARKVTGPKRTAGLPENGKRS